MSTEKKPNIYDVAKLAEVSHQTVSRVLNGHASIRPDQTACRTGDGKPGLSPKSGRTCPRHE